MNTPSLSRRDAPQPGPDCASYASLLPVLDEPAADAAQMARARAHLRGCAYCQGQVAAYDRLDAVLRRQFGFAATPRLATENIMADIEEPVSPMLYPVPLDESARDPATARQHGSRPPRRNRGRLSALASIAAVLLVATLAGVIYGTHTRRPTVGVTNATPHRTVPPGSQTALKAVSMDSPTDGWALGDVSPSDNTTKPVFMHYTGGSWRTVDVGFAGEFQSVSMVSATDGWAVGFGVLAHYDGRAWTLVTNTLHGSLNAVRMLSATEGWAVGAQSYGNQDEYGLYGIMRYDGSSWTPQALPPIPGLTSAYSVELYSLDMLSPTEGWAAGQAQVSEPSSTPGPPSTYTPAPTDAAIILHYTGGSWALAYELPSAQVNQISMGSSTDGWAIGSVESWNTSKSGPIGSATPLLLRYTGGGWATASEPRSGTATWTPGEQSVLDVSATDVWLATVNEPPNQDATTTTITFLHDDGSGFLPATVTLDGRQSANIAAISMLSPTEGWAVGTAYWPRKYGVPSGAGPGYTPTITPLILHFHNGMWSVALD